MRQEMIGFWDAVVSAGPYANNLHLAPDRQSHQHPITHFFYRPDALPDAKALKATSTGGNSTESILASIIKCIFTGFQKIPKKKIQGAFFGTAYKYTKMSHNIIRIYPAVHLRNDHSNYHKRYVLITNAAKLW